MDEKGGDKEEGEEEEDEDAVDDDDCGAEVSFHVSTAARATSSSRIPSGCFTSLNVMMWAPVTSFRIRRLAVPPSV